MKALRNFLLGAFTVLALFAGALNAATSTDGTKTGIGGSIAPLVIESSNVVSQRNGTNAQSSYIYNTYTDASNYERGAVRWTTNEFVVAAESAGSGSSRSLVLDTAAAATPIALRTGGVTRITVSNANIDVAAIVRPTTNNTVDLGAVTTREFRTGYFGTSVIAPYVRTPATTVALLTTCNAAFQGARAMVTDANSTTFLAAAAGGGANVVPVVCNGTGWVIG
jgi:hypothetical protein